MRAPWTSTLFRVNGKSAEMGWLMMAPLARPRWAQRQEVAQGGDEIAPTVDVGVAAVVGGHALDLRHGRQLRVQDRQIGLPGDGRGAGSNDFRSWRSPTRTSNWAAASVALRITFRLPPDSPTSRPAACRRSEPSADFSIFREPE